MAFVFFREGVYLDHPHYHMFEDEVCYKCEEGRTERVRHPAGESVTRRNTGRENRVSTERERERKKRQKWVGKKVWIGRRRIKRVKP